MILKIFLLSLSLFALYYRPFYSILFWFIFSFEYIYFIGFLYDIYRKYDDYLVIENEEIDISDSSALNIWLEYCRLSAFARLYNILSKKGMKKKNLILLCIVYFLNIPIKFIEISYYFIRNKESFREGLILRYCDLYFILKNLKIEVISKKIYLNCYTLGKLLFELKARMNEQIKIVKLLMEWKKINERHRYYRMSLGYSAFKKGVFITGKNNKVSIPHFLYKEGDNIMHATSYIPEILDESQKSDIPIPTLTKNNAENPGTILTKNSKGVILDNNKIKLVSNSEINVIKYRNMDMYNLGNEDYEIIHGIVIDYKYSSQSNIHRINDDLVNDLLMGRYDYALSTLKEEDILSQIRGENMSHNINDNNLW